MVGRRKYKILGMTPELLEAWSSDLRTDIIVWQHNGEVQARIYLTRLEAFLMNIRMKFNNMKQPYALRLEEAQN